MADLINMPRAAWKRQPTGAVDAHYEWVSRKMVWLSSAHQMIFGPIGGLINLVDRSVAQNYDINQHLFKGYTLEGICGYPTGSYLNYLKYYLPYNLLYGCTEFTLLHCFCFGVNDPSVQWLNFRTDFSNTLDIFAQTTNSITFGTDWTTAWNGLEQQTLDGLCDKQRVCIASVVRQNGARLFANGKFLGTKAGSPFIITDNSYMSICQGIRAAYLLSALFTGALCDGEMLEITENPWQLFKPRPARFISIPSGGGAATYTAALSVDALIQRAGLTHSTHLDALLQSAFSKSLSLDSLIAAVQAQTISLDALLQIAGTRTITIDALLQATKSDVISIDALVQMTLAQSLSLDALIVAMGFASSSMSIDALLQSLKTASVSLDALLSTSAMQSVLLDALLQSSKTSFVSLDGLIQAAEIQTLSLDALVQAVQSGTISLDALLSKSNISTIVIDALIQSSKTGAVSLDALITGASSASVFTGLDALIQAIQSKTLSVDALLQKAYTSPLALDAYVALTRVQSVSLDALIQASKTGVVSLDALIQMTRTVTVSFDALIQSAKTGVISLDAILVFATQASILLDAYVQKTLARGVGLDAIIGAIADMILPTGRVITVPASDRFVFITHSDRVIQIQ